MASDEWLTDATSLYTYEYQTASNYYGSEVISQWLDLLPFKTEPTPYEPVFDHKENNRRVKMALRPSERRIDRWGRIERGTRPWTIV